MKPVGPRRKPARSPAPRALAEYLRVALHYSQPEKPTVHEAHRGETSVLMVEIHRAAEVSRRPDDHVTRGEPRLIGVQAGRD